IRAAVCIMIFGLFIIGMMEIWGATLYTIDLVKEGFMKGFPLFGVFINPMQIVVGLFAFSLISIIGRMISAHITRRHHYDGREESQVAIASIINYITFAIALLAGLLIAGVNFTGLAI